VREYIPVVFTDDIRTRLDQRFLARVTTIDAAGYPHTVPIWYIRMATTL